MAKGTQIILSENEITGRGNSLNPFVMVDGAAEFIEFVEQVLDGREVSEARAATPAGLLIHAEVRVGDSLLLVVDAQPGWAVHPGLFQIWVRDVGEVVARARQRGSSIVTSPTPFYGSNLLARLDDPWGNLWWIYQPVPGQEDPRPIWEGGDPTVFRTLDDHLRRSSGTRE